MYCQRQTFCLGLALRDICGGHCGIMMVHSQYIQSSTYYDRIIWCHYVPIYVSRGLT